MILGELKQTGESTGDLSRDDVRAQREAKKQAKAARKNKSSGKGAEPEGSKKEASEAPSTGGKAKEQRRSPNVGLDKENVPASTKPVDKNLRSEGATAKPPPPLPPKSDQKSKGKKAPAQKRPEVKGTTSSTKSGQITEPSKAGSKTDGFQESASYSVIHSLFQLKKGEDFAKAKAFQLHPLFYNIGLKVRNNAIRGANSKCVKLFEAIKDYVRSYEVPPGAAFKHGLSGDLEANINHLKTTCPFSISMNNAVQFVLFYLHNYHGGNLVDLKNELLGMIDQYLEEKIAKAVEAIVLYGLEKINPGNKIMVYSITEALTSLLVKAVEKGIPFELILIQLPNNMLELSELLEKLSKKTIILD